LKLQTRKKENAILFFILSTRLSTVIFSAYGFFIYKKRLTKKSAFEKIALWRSIIFTD